ncbi:MAG: PsbP-related protein [bacterium]
MPYCQNCGKQISESAKFCSGCGKKVNEEPVKEVSLSKPDKLNRFKWLHYIIGLALIILVIIVIGVGRSLKQEPTETVSPPTNETKETISTQTSEQPTSAIKKFLMYDSSAYGIRIKYPSNWTKTEQVMGSVAAFLSPQETASDIFQENLNVIVQDLSTQPMTLEEFTELSVGQVKQFITDAKILDSNATTLDGNSAHEVVYTGKQGQYNLKFMQVWAIKDNTAYILTYTAEIKKYNNYLNLAQEMMNSFEII